jgi:hypothetical protein
MEPRGLWSLRHSFTSNCGISGSICTGCGAWVSQSSVGAAASSGWYLSLAPHLLVLRPNWWLATTPESVPVDRRVHPRLAAVGVMCLVVFALIGMRANPWSRRWLEHVAVRTHRAHAYDAAAWAYERSLAYGADSGWALHNLALSYQGLGDTARRDTAMTVLKRLAPSDAESLHVYFNALLRRRQSVAR